MEGLLSLVDYNPYNSCPSELAPISSREKPIPQSSIEKEAGMIRYFLGVLAALLLVCNSVSAQVSCQDNGAFTYCNNGQSFQRNGSFTYDNHGNSWQHNGNFTYGSDGTSYQRNGAFTYDNRGNSWQQNGNFTYGSNGTSCQRVGSFTYCN
jgi:hypothetical protein